MSEAGFKDVRGYVFVKTHPGKTIDAQHAIVDLDGVVFAAIITGEFDVLVGFRVENTEMLGELVAGHIEAVDGVRETNTSVIVSFASNLTTMQLLGTIGRDDGP